MTDGQSSSREATLSTGGPVALRGESATRLRPAAQGTISGGFWRGRQDINGEVAIIEAYDRLVEAGNLDNLCIIAGEATGEARGPVFMDSDIYKWLEAVAWEYARRPTDRLLELQREVTALVARAQAEDGYIDSVVQLRENGERYGHLIRSHELYCAGHLIQAAVAQARCTPDTALLDVAIKFADHLVATFGTDKLVDIDGHPIIEMALVELFRETGERDYLDLASFFVEARGHGILDQPRNDPTYFSDRLPVREATSFEGHAVRAVYFAAGAADVAIETGDEGLWQALGRQFDRTWERKTYLTGGLGARWEGEAFGDEFELPSDRAYAETCAAIGAVQFAWRMLLATGDGKYADAIERLLYNAFLPGVSLSGDEYFYVNALQLRTGAEADNERSVAHGRRAWFDVACCPPNIMRTLASLGSYLATTDADGIQLQQFAAGSIVAELPAGRAALTVTTEYPRNGDVAVSIDEAPGGEWTLSLRVPAWAGEVTAEVVSGGQAGTVRQIAPGYLTVRRDWREGDTVSLCIPFAARLLVADERVDALRDQIAVEYGPLVYCAEQADQEGIDDALVAPGAATAAHWHPELLGGVNVLTVEATRVAEDEQSAGALPYYPAPVPAETAGRTELTLVPYYAWGNRELGPMRVWLRRAGSEAAD